MSFNIKNNYLIVVSGILFGLGFLFKFHSLFDFVALLFFHLVFLFINKEKVLLSFEIFSALLSGRFYFHYLLQPVLGLSLTLTYLISHYKLISRQVILFILASLLLFGIFEYENKLKHIEKIDRPNRVLYVGQYYGHFFNHLFKGTINDFVYTDWFNDDERKLSILKTNVSIDKEVYIYFDIGWAYYYIKQPPPIPVFVPFQFFYEGLEDRKYEAMRELDHVQVIVIDKESVVFSELDEVILHEWKLCYEDEYFEYHQKSHCTEKFLK